jgi:hypothetical protein
MNLSFESESQNLEDEKSLMDQPQQSLFRFNKKKNPNPKANDMNDKSEILDAKLSNMANEKGINKGRK